MFIDTLEIQYFANAGAVVFMLEYIPKVGVANRLSLTMVSMIDSTL